MSLEKCRASNNTIFRINDGNSVLTQCHDILSFINNYYENIYKSPPRKPDFYSSEACRQFLNKSNVYVLSDEEKHNSGIPISGAELLTALKSMKNGSSPGLDGLPIETYKVFWDDLNFL